MPYYYCCCCCCCCYCCWDPLSRYSDQAMGSTIWGWNLGRDKGFLSSPKFPYRLWGPPSLLFNGYRDSVPGVKQPARDVDSSHPSSTQVKNEWNYATTSLIRLRGMKRENFAFYVSKISVLWNVIFCRLLYRCRCFGLNLCLHLQDFST